MKHERESNQLIARLFAWRRYCTSHRQSPALCNQDLLIKLESPLPGLRLAPARPVSTVPTVPPPAPPYTSGQPHPPGPARQLHATSAARARATPI